VLGAVVLGGAPHRSPEPTTLRDMLGRKGDPQMYSRRDRIHTNGGLKKRVTSIIYYTKRKRDGNLTFVNRGDLRKGGQGCCTKNRVDG